MALHDRELSLSFVGDAEMLEINSQYRGKDATTNVLSFAMDDGDSTFVSPLLGDVIISCDTAAREAIERGVSLDQRYSQLLVHGILHLAGYDHELGEEEEEAMAEKSIELLRLIEPDADLDYF
ncbi:rRNA maturation RNase YbeY [Desulfoluna limicola]|uniref:rRNA maturation RNase YbeY n=1 Tax=Desulfoluna limicola TaxID=2810562 RepID=UPI001F00EA79|nr:rRNA maturation RNase YbeY [Desulfoluna limicola]